MATPNTLTNRVRVGGSGFTVLTFDNKPIVFAQQVAHNPPQAVGAGFSAIHPMDEPYPVEVITAAAAGMGQLVLNLYELYGSKVWDRLGASVGSGLTNPFGGGNVNSTSQNITIGSDAPFAGANDIVDVFITQARTYPQGLSVVKYIRPIVGTPYSDQYHGCVITNVVDGEQIDIGTLEVVKQITISYRYMQRSNGIGTPLGFALRNAAL